MDFETDEPKTSEYSDDDDDSELTVAYLLSLI